MCVLGKSEWVVLPRGSRLMNSTIFLINVQSCWLKIELFVPRISSVPPLLSLLLKILTLTRLDTL